MVHGQEKRRDMVRSLLPSTHRKGTRYERARRHRTARHHSHEQMTQLLKDPESFESLADWDGDGTQSSRLVSERREGDKLAPFIRWARAHTRALSPIHRMGYLRSLVPPGLIGLHALSHLERERDFMHPNAAAIGESRPC